MPTDDPKKQKAFTQIYYSYNNQILVVNAKQKLGMRTTVILSHPAAITSNDDDKMVPTTNRYGNLSLSRTDGRTSSLLFVHIFLREHEALTIMNEKNAFFF